MSAPSPLLTLTIDTQQPTMKILDIAPNPRNTAVDAILISFSEAPADFTLADLKLTRDGGANLLTGAESLISIGDNLWLLSGLSSLTATGGTYTLSIDHLGVHDLAGNLPGADASTAWRKTNLISLGDTTMVSDAVQIVGNRFSSGGDDDVLEGLVSETDVFAG